MIEIEKRGVTAETLLDCFLDFLIQDEELERGEGLNYIFSILNGLEDWGKWPVEYSDPDIVEKWAEFHESDYFPEEIDRGENP